MGFNINRTEDIILPTARYSSSSALVGPLVCVAYWLLSVMPPSFPHAVFTPENCLAVGGQIYTAAHLGRSLEGLKVQEDHPDISNEDLHDSDYSTLARILRECGAVTTSVEKAQIVSSCSLFPQSPACTASDKLSKTQLMDILKSRGVAFASRAKKPALLELLKTHGLRIEEISGGEAKRMPREEFVDAIRAFPKEFT
jgi:hypothetical protein